MGRLMKRYSSVVFALVCGAQFAGCATRMPPLAADRTAVIAGHVTAGLSGPDATRALLQGAARVTVDHGAQYFRLVQTDARAAYDIRGYDVAIRPGAAVTIKVYQAGEVRTGAPGLWDAEKILASGVPDNALASATVAPARQQRGATKATPRCTAYGCDW